MAGDGDSLRRVKAGDRAQIPADAYNAMLSVVRDRRAAAFDGGAPAVRIPSHPPATVLVRNDTGGDLDRFAVVVPGAPAVAHADDATEFFRRPNLAGDAPEGGEAVFAVLLEPAADGDFAPAQVSGVCPVQINVTDEAHAYASPVAGDTEMLGSDTAGAPVLWKESGTGTKWAYVLLGSPVAGGAIEVEAADGTPAYASVTKVTFDQADGFVLTNPSAGVVAVDLTTASYTDVGIVDLSAQGFKGFKTFNDGLVAKQSFGSSALVTLGYDSDEGAFGVVFNGDAGGTAALVGGASGIQMQSRTVASTNSLAKLHVVPHTITAITYDENDDWVADTTMLVYGKYAVVPLGDSQHTGQTGTLADGSVVKGGIITSIAGTIDGGTW